MMCRYLLYTRHKHGRQNHKIGERWNILKRHTLAVGSTVRETTGTAVGALAVVAIVAAHGDASRRTRTSGDGRVAAQHGNARAVLGAAKRDHVLADVSSDNLTTLRVGVGEDVLDQVVTKLVTSDWLLLVSIMMEKWISTYCR